MGAIDLKKFKEDLRTGVKESLKPLLETAERRSKMAGETKKAGDKDYISTCKYLLGASTGNWVGAEKEEKAFEETQKALTELTGAGGGFLVHPQIDTRVIELVRAKAVMRALGAMVITLARTNSIKIPKQTGGAVAEWIGESEDKPLTEPEFGELELVLKEIGAIVKVPNSLLEDSTPSADKIVETDLAKAIAITEDRGLMRGIGGKQPVGLYNWPGIASTTLTAAITADDLLDVMSAIEQADGEYNFWLMHPRSKNTIRQLKLAGDYVFRMAGAGVSVVQKPDDFDSLLGLRVHYTTTIPTNLTFGTLTNCSWIVLGHSAEYMITDKKGLKIDVSTQAGDAFRKNQTWFRAVKRVDGGVRREEFFHILKGVR